MMKFCVKIEKYDVLAKALLLVKKAQKEIIVTMNMQEEIVAPLPSIYHKLLDKKIDGKLKVIRYGYGRKELFNKLKKKYARITFIYKGSIRKYLRMIVIDRKRGMFSVNGQVFYTGFRPLVLCLMIYADIGNYKN